MFSHVMLGANDIEESKVFYDETLLVLGARPGKLSLNHDGHTRYVYFVNNKNSFIISSNSLEYGTDLRSPIEFLISLSATDEMFSKDNLL